MENVKEMVESIIDEVMKRQGTTIISSVDDEGYPNTKAMLEPRKREGLKTFYFSTNTSSKKVSQYKKNSKACLYFYDLSTFRGIMLKGNIEVLEDQKTKEDIWREGDLMYYSKGKTDPDYCVLKFTGKEGRIYKNFVSYDFIV